MRVTTDTGVELATDDDSGEGAYSCLGLYLIKGQRVIVLVSLKGEKTAGDFVLQMRRQKSKIFTFTYEGFPDSIDTRTDATIPSQELDKIGYGNRTYVDAGSGTEQEDGEAFYQMGSEVYVYAGHGAPGMIAYTQKENGVMKGYSFRSIDIPDMHNTKLAVWGACHSAQADGMYPSMAEMSVLQGAKSAIGWEEAILVVSCRQFKNKLFEHLGDGETVLSASMNAANSLANRFDKVKDFISFGECSNTTLLSPQIHPRKNVAAKETIATEEEITAFYSLLEKQEYLPCDLGSIDGEKTTRYYRLIDGMEVMNDFIDVTMDENDNSIISIKYSKDSVEEDKLIEAKSSVCTAARKNNMPYRMLNSTENSLVSQENYRMLVLYNNEVIPVQFIDSVYRYVDPEDSNFSFNYADMKCYNIETGEEINYEDIMCVENQGE